MMSSYSPAACVDMRVRLVRGFTYIQKMDNGKIQYQVPAVAADKLFLTKESSEKVKKRAKRSSQRS